MNLSTCRADCRRLMICCTALTIGVAAQSALGDSGPPPAPSIAPTTQPLRAGTIGAGDLVCVTIYGLTRASDPEALLVRITADGEVHLPLAGRVKLAGLTTDRAGQEVSRAYQEAKIINKGVMSVGIVRPASESTVRNNPVTLGDKLQVTVFDIAGPGQRLVTLAVVAENGTILLPMVGEVKVDGVAEIELDRTVARQYREKQIHAQPIVSVLRLQENGLP